MKLSDLLDRGTILTGLKASGPADVIGEMLESLVRSGQIREKDSILKDLLQSSVFSAMPVPHGVAIPHARIEGLERPVALFGLSRKGVPLEGRQVHIFLLFLTPVEETELHLQLLSEAEAIFADPGLRHALLRAETPAAALTVLVRFEHALGGRETYCPLSIEEVLRELGTRREGLTEAEAARLLERFGPNLLRQVRGRPLIFRFLENLYNLLALLLWVGGALAFVADMPELGWAIFFVIIVNAVFSFWQEYKAEKALEALKRLMPHKARVARSGSESEVSAEDLVPGDVILLEEGEGIPADARLIEAFDLRVDNSALTGESRPIYKTSEIVPEHREHLWTEIPNIVFAGTAVMTGAGRAVVIATGMHTEIGRIATLTQEVRLDKSPLQRELEKVTRFVTVLSILMGVLFFFLGRHVGELSLAAAFLFAIGIIVANVPEGLLPTVSLSLAMAVQRMARRHALIKRLSSVETLGSTTVICTDKTGTLTTNEINVTRVWISGRQLEVTGKGRATVGEFRESGRPLATDQLRETGIALLFDTSILCSNAALHAPSSPDGIWARIGDPTEAALLAMATKAGVDIEASRKEKPRIGQLPFEAVRKRMSSINRVEGSPVAFVKGAPAETLALCTHIQLNGREESITEALRSEIRSANDAMAEEGLRVLALAYRPLAADTGFTVENTERDLIFVGLAGMMDPPRPEVPAAIALCHRAGIRVVMMTGDYGLTAISIARKIGLVRDPSQPPVITGPELDRLDDEALKKALGHRELIFARVTPEHKLRVVSSLQAQGEVVAVTGDGVNDAPALKKADIGVAMGIRGADVAKEAAAMILMDDNFSSIVAAIEEGRAVYANIRKFVTYILASNIPEGVPFIAYVLFRVPLPLTVMQILAVDLGTDLVPALGLGAEKPEPGIMDRPPRPKTARLLDLPLLLRAYCFLGLMEAATSMLGFFAVYWLAGWRPGETMQGTGPLYVTATTMTLAGIVASQVGNVFACRTDRESIFRVGLASNRLVLWGIVAELALLGALVYVPPLQRVFGLAPLGMEHWTILLAFPVLMVLMEEGRKWLVRRNRLLAPP